MRIKTHMERTREQSFLFIVVSTLVALTTLYAVSWVAGFHHVLTRIDAVNPIWFVAAFFAEVLAYLGYVTGWREVARVEHGQDVDQGDAIAAVTAGFGPFIARGGFAVDVSAFKAAGLSDREVRARVMGLGALEYAMLAPAACIVAIRALARGAHNPSIGLTLPWAIAVPIGFAFALWAMQHRDRFNAKPGWRGHVGDALDSIYVLRCLFVRPKHMIGPVGTAVYWFGDIVCLWACLHAFTHGTPSITIVLIGYATGYALSRRTLPLGGAGAVEALLPFALSWCGVSLAAAVMAVFSYRVFNLWLPTLPAAYGLRHLRASSR